MEEGLKVILSADVSNFQEAFSRAAQTAKQQVNSINQTLASTSKSAEAAAKTWNQFVGERMSAAMKQFGSHGAAIRAIAAEWAVYKQAVAQAGAAGTGIGQTAQAVQKVAQAMGSMKQVQLPSTEGVVLGLNKAESALKKLAAGESYVRDLDRSIKLLVASTQTIGRTPEIDQLISALQRLQASKQQLNATGLDIRPNVDVADTLRAIERIKSSVAGEQFRFNLTADGKSLQGAMVQATQATQAAVKDINTVLSTVNFAPPSTAALVQGLAQAEAAVKRFSTGSASVEDLNNAILQLTRSKEGLSNTGAVDKLITKLQALHTTAAGVQTTGLNINPTVNVADTLRDIERIKGLIAGQEFSFTLSADGKPLQTSMAQAVDSTQGAEQAISNATKGVSESFDRMAQAARLSVGEYIKALGQMDNVPTAVKTTVQAPDMTPVLRAVEQVKSSIKTATEASLPRLTLLADTAPFNSALAGSQAAAREAAQTIGTSFDQIGAATSGAASKAGANVAELIRNFNALKGAGPNAIVTQVVPPNFAPVIAAARKAKRDMDNAFVTPLPALKMPPFTPPRGLGELSKGANQAQAALIDLSRIAQDAPYGFIGIANNINPLVESFQRLRATSGSTGSAFKALAGSLMGPAGLGLAIGVASSLLVTFGDKINLFKKKFDIFKASIGEAAKSTGEELVKLKIYQDKLNDTTLTNEQRIKVAREYNKVADETNKIDLTQINNLTLLNQKISDQTKLIQQRALSAAAISKLTDASSKLIEQELELQSQLQATGLSYEDVQKAADAAFKKQLEGTQAVRKGLDGLQTQKPILGDRSENQIQGVSNALISLFNQVKTGRYEFDKLSDSLRNFITVPGLTTKDGGKTGGSKKPVFEFLDEFLDFNPNAAKITDEQKAKLIEVINKYSDQFGQILEGANFRGVQGGNDQMIAAAKQWWDDFQKGIVKLAPRKIDVDFSQIPITPEGDKLKEGVVMPINFTFTPEQIRQNAVQDAINDVVNQWRQSFRDAELVFPAVDYSKFKDPAALNDYLKGLQAFKENAREILSSAATDAVSGFAEGIGSALAGAGVGDAFSGILSSIGSAIMELGKQMILGSSIIQAFKKALASLVANPAAGLAVGASMVAVGAAIKASASKVMKFEAGGIIYGPTMGLMGEYAGASSNPEVVAPLSKLKDMIKGAGGATSVNVNGSWEVAGDKLRLVLARSNRKSNRYQ